VVIRPYAYFDLLCLLYTGGIRAYSKSDKEKVCWKNHGIANVTLCLHAAYCNFSGVFRSSELSDMFLLTLQRANVKN